VGDVVELPQTEESKRVHRAWRYADAAEKSVRRAQLALIVVGFAALAAAVYVVTFPDEPAAD
jgi:CHASE3 domain sensor protein